MTYQLRTYRIEPGALEQWVAEWSAGIKPLREQHGFRVVAAGVDDSSGQFVWLLAHDGPASFEEADDAYYASPERRALDPDPARHIVETLVTFLRPVV